MDFFVILKLTSIFYIYIVGNYSVYAVVRNSNQNLNGWTTKAVGQFRMPNADTSLPVIFRQWNLNFLVNSLKST